jgi:hypothetical protein
LIDNQFGRLEKEKPENAPLISSPFAIDPENLFPFARPSAAHTKVVYLSAMLVHAIGTYPLPAFNTDRTAARAKSTYHPLSTSLHSRQSSTSFGFLTHTWKPDSCNSPSLTVPLLFVCIR